MTDSGDLIVVVMKQATDRRRRDAHAIGPTAAETVCGRPESDIVSVLLDQEDPVEWFDWVDGLFRTWYVTCPACKAATSEPEPIGEVRSDA